MAYVRFEIIHGKEVCFPTEMHSLCSMSCDICISWTIKMKGFLIKMGKQINLPGNTLDLVTHKLWLNLNVLSRGKLTNFFFQQIEFLGLIMFPRIINHN